MRGRLRTHLSVVGVVGLLFGLLALFALVSQEFAWARSDVLSLVGILISVVLAIFTSEYMRGIRRLRIGIVIPSLRPFHREIRRGLREILADQNDIFIDPYVEEDNPEEDLSNFLLAFHRALQMKSDYLVICAPSVELANSPAILSECGEFARKGGHVFFIESVPSESMLAALRFVTTVVSDSTRGAELLADYAIELWRLLPERERADSSVLLVPGPAHSRPAKERLAAMEKKLSDVPTCIAHTSSWTTAEAKAVVMRELSDCHSIRIICCGNDDMAIGAAQALFELNRKSVQILGHDGLYDFVASIAEPFSPAAATIRIPPRAFGFRIGARIRSLPLPWKLLLPGGWWLSRKVVPEIIVLPISRSSLVTCFTAPSLLASR